MKYWFIIIRKKFVNSIKIWWYIQDHFKDGEEVYVKLFSMMNLTGLQIRNFHSIFVRFMRPSRKKRSKIWISDLLVVIQPYKHIATILKVNTASCTVDNYRKIGPKAFNFPVWAVRTIRKGVLIEGSALIEVVRYELT